MAAEKTTHRVTSRLDLDRPIYTLGVASEMLDAHPRTLMVYEQLDLIKPQRTPTNRRRYSPRDVMKLQAIQKLTRRHGVNLAGARFILALLKQLHDNEVEPPARFRDVDVSSVEL
ncbi:MAG TPA: MerR family transcriptional regulator [Candidatus Dormibacteraeota bacterium]|jgi:MerR family transcriptional regulator/heat shock protein HspR